MRRRQRIWLVSLTAVVLVIAFSGCIGQARRGTIEPIREPAKTRRAKAVVQFNKATELLEQAWEAQTKKIDDQIWAKVWALIC